MIPRLTAIGSGKGGTGKTFVTLALAQAFADMGERVLVCDADLGLSNTAVQLGLPQGGDLPGFLAGRTALKDAVVPVQAPPHAAFHLLAAAPGTTLADALGETAERLAAQLRRVTPYDRVVIDLAAGVGGAVMTLAAQADDTLVLVTPDPTSLTDAYAFIKLMLKRCGRAPVFAVNNAGPAEAKRTAEALAQSAKSFLKAAPAYLGYVPTDARVIDAIRRQTALCALHPQSPAAAAIAALAASLGGRNARLPAAASLR